VPSDQWEPVAEPVAVRKAARNSSALRKQAMTSVDRLAPSSARRQFPPDLSPEDAAREEALRDELLTKAETS
jgi:hypothetical protein